jgi:hypothetical protein
MMPDPEDLNDLDLVRLDDDDRAALREASELLEGIGVVRASWLAGRLAGLAGRVPAEVESQN